MTVLRDQSFPLDDYATGIYNIPASIVGSWVTNIYVEIVRCTTENPTIWPNENSEISYRQELSFDNGQTWVAGGGFGAFGGIYIRKDNTEAQISSFVVGIPPEQDGRNRRLRGTIEIINGPIRTEGFYELRDEEG